MQFIPPETGHIVSSKKKKKSSKEDMEVGENGGGENGG